MEIRQNYDLTKRNTLGVHVCAKEFVEIHEEQDLKELFDLKEFKENKKIFLGGGSNVLFTKDFDGIVVLNKLKGIIELPRVPLGKDEILIRAMSGEVWHDLVLFAVEKEYWGIENLSLIPGSVGGAPVQNIGAYGAELKDVLVQVETYSVLDGTKRIFEKRECEFGYRDSIFKSRLKGQYFISAIVLKLSKTSKPNLSYEILRDYLEQNKIEVHSSKDVSDAVASIRRSKLPDPNIISNAGSFFKNVFVDKEKLQELLTSHPDIKYFKESADAKAKADKDEKIKIPAGWLIEQCGWKGKRIGNVGVHKEHALVLVNYGGGTGEDLKNLAGEITESVFSKFGLKLISEVNLI